ncbi:hypothetical protein J4710_11475 [Staphylococcus xylosus]|uniref:Serine protease n=1 Tax=Staphylococcus xylosus TaxID=1288 RepID=A0A939NM22_STAXY|nr:hypothetical protein [Staphylococcus xylosus]
MKLSEPIETAGYPADKGGWTLYKGNSLLKITNFNVYYDIDTYGGQSGSPVWNRDKKIIGVHTYGSSPLNFATKINDTNLKLIKNGRTSQLAMSTTKMSLYPKAIFRFGTIFNFILRNH